MGLIIGLTGGIASGKSLVSAIMAENGATVIDADLLSRDVVRRGEPALDEIRALFGDKVLRKNGSLDRKALGDIVFNDPEALEQLNRIVHPRVIALLKSVTADIFKKDPSTIVVIDAPLLIETGTHHEIDQLVVVYVSTVVQIQRLMERDHLSREQALRRMSLQMSLEEKIAIADHVIDNSGTPEDTRAQVEELMHKIGLNLL
jgi:dephospho-CoA kinase